MTDPGSTASIVTTVWDVGLPHLRKIVEATGVMLGAWLLIERLFGWIPKKLGKAVKPMISFVLGMAGLLILDEITTGATELHHHDGWLEYLFDHKRPLFYGLVAGGLPVFLHRWLKKKMPAIFTGNNKEEVE